MQILSSALCLKQHPQPKPTLPPNPNHKYQQIYTPPLPLSQTVAFLNEKQSFKFLAEDGWCSYPSHSFEKKEEITR